MEKSIVKKRGKIKVFCAMSGGVDSSVAAYLLKKQGYDVTGVFMKCFNIDGCAEQDAFDARRVAEHLRIPFYVFDFERDYKKRVVKYMVDGYRNGLTPNPDVMCNKEIKFGLFLEKALKLGADFVATGHYVRLVCLSNTLAQGVSGATPKSYPSQGYWTSLPIQRKGLEIKPIRENENRKFFLNQSVGSDSNKLLSRARGRRELTEGNSRRLPEASENDLSIAETLTDEGKNFYSLYEAKDKNKDQSYFLWTLTQEQLKHCLFPIGDYLKSEVRAMARKVGLPTALKKDSQGICFLGDVSIRDFLKKYIKPKKGAILTTDGKKIGEHSGAWFYTIGQRHGLDLKTKNQELNIKGKYETKPHYVVSKSVKANTLVVAEGSGNPALRQKKIKLINLNFVSVMDRHIRTNSSIEVKARVRYRQPLTEATLFLEKENLARLVFKTPQKFIASGQSAVFYAKTGEMLGGGVIL